jgi:signal transduction histidine kinase
MKAMQSKKIMSLFIASEGVNQSDNFSKEKENSAAVFLTEVKSQILKSTQTKLADDPSATFLSAVSHELKNPLNAIIGFAELLKRGKADPVEVEDYISEILQAANEMNELANDLLDVGQVNSGNFSIDMSKEIDVRNVIKRVLKINSNYALKNNIKISVDVADDVKVIKLDEKRMKQILSNLVSNAVKYSPTSSAIKISVKNIFEEKKEEIEKEKEEKKFLEIKVSDSGFGMTAAQVQLAFKKYQIIRNPNSGKVDSFGLGLPIVKQLTELMNGTIEVKSEINKGTEVNLKFPYSSMMM